MKSLVRTNYQLGIMADQNSESSELSDSSIFISGTDNQDGKFKKRLSRLLRIQQLQKSIVKQNMHNAMSPLSAISGYLELIDMTLEQDASIDQIEHYRKKIEVGITEVNEILQQLNAVYQEEELEELEDSYLEVDLNWAIRDVCDQIKANPAQVSFTSTMKPLHIKTALFTLKLIIYKLISYAIKCSSKKNQVKLITKEEEEMANLEITFNLSDQKARDIREVLTCQNEKDEFECIKQNSMNEGLLASNKLVDQIGGFLRFKMLEGQTGRLCLSLPLST